MQSRHFEVVSATAGLTTRHLCSIATKLALGTLAAALVATAAVPALAGKPDRDRPAGRHAQQQEQELSAARKRKGNKNKTVEKTFSSGDAITIPAVSSSASFGPAGPYPSTIAVTGFKSAKITDLNLTLRTFSHEFAPDVDVLLVAPDGRNVVAMGDVGNTLDSSGVTNLTITLDDEAAAALPAAEDEALTNSSFQPLDNFGLVDNENPASGQLNDFPAPAPTPSGNNALSTFDGIDPNGEWQLFVLDDNSSDVGSLANGWTLEISAKSKVKNKNKRRR
jgi:subtilisin-like proprotein convertase family protein